MLQINFSNIVYQITDFILVRLLENVPKLCTESLGGRVLSAKSAKSQSDAKR